jgi:3-keto-5-aminohexanoate cleavage enzyme
MKSILISVAPNGARKQQVDIPTLPISPEELALEARRCLDAGVALFHLHIRNEDGSHSLDPERYRRAIHAIRLEVGMELILQISTETCDIFAPEDIRYLVTTLWPEAASIGVRDLIPAVEYEAPARAFLSEALAHSVMIQYILYSEDDIAYFSDLIRRGIIPHQKRFLILLVLGKKTGFVATPDMLHPLLATLNTMAHSFEYDWALCAFGPHELDCMCDAVAHGGWVRIGFENNHVLSTGMPAPHNGALIEFTASLSTDQRYFTAAEFRDYCNR